MQFSFKNHCVYELIQLFSAKGVMDRHEADLAKPLAVPMIGGILTSAIHVLFVTPVIFVILKEYFRKKSKLKKSEMAKFIVH